MPLLDDDTMTPYKADGGFQFSGVDINNHLTASEYTLVGVCCDRSLSVSNFVKELESCVVNTFKGCSDSPRVDNLLVRLTTFATQIEEVHGYRHLVDCPLNVYTGFLKPMGTTHLYDATVEMLDSMSTYGRKLQDQEYKTNGILVIITDGEDIGSTFKAKNVSETLAKIKHSETLESILTILIGINISDPTVSDFLKEFKTEANIDQYIEAGDASPKTLAKISGFIAQSVSSQSQALGTGSASQPINY